MLLLNRYRGIVGPLFWGFIAAVLVGVLMLFKPNYYRSEARILPVEAKASSGSLGGLLNAAAALGASIPSGDGSENNFVDILESRTIREGLLRTQFHFWCKKKAFEAGNEYTETLAQYMGISNLDRGVKALGRVLVVKRDPKTRVLSITAETKSPQLSQLVVQRSILLLESFVQTRGRTRGGAKATFAEARLEEARKESGQAEEEFRAFINNNRNYTTSNDPTVRLRGLALESEFKLRQQLVTTLALNREQALLEEKNDIPVLNVMDAGNLPLVKSRPARLTAVLLAFFCASLAGVLWKMRRWFLAWILSDDWVVSGRAGGKA